MRCRGARTTGPLINLNISSELKGPIEKRRTRGFVPKPLARSVTSKEQYPKETRQLHQHQFQGQSVVANEIQLLKVTIKKKTDVKSFIYTPVYLAHVCNNSNALTANGRASLLTSPFLNAVHPTLTIHFPIFLHQPSNIPQPNHRQHCRKTV